ncbi:hypothetical protein ASPCAL09662 [Aspergillus calidoustus]|uniref:Uncharacterized protein n=1 Tax=Aspergillus calidoustus TaxID=454130 RepID=A0A0U4Z9M8_ASPCI|nr:hypothetical protein ASPCAL09662 [Aspergillus calidoustus]
MCATVSQPEPPNQDDVIPPDLLSAVCLIQRVYRGYRARRELQGRQLSATNRWAQNPNGNSATAPQPSPPPPPSSKPIATGRKPSASQSSPAATAPSRNPTTAAANRCQR